MVYLGQMGLVTNKQLPFSRKVNFLLSEIEKVRISSSRNFTSDPFFLDVCERKQKKNQCCKIANLEIFITFVEKKPVDRIFPDDVILNCT